MNKERIVIDAFPLLYATTGIKTYIREMIAALTRSGREESNFDYLIVPKAAVHFLNGKPKRPFYIRYFFHLSYFVWKQLLLPILVFQVKAKALICPDFIAPFYLGKIRKLVVIHDAFLWQEPQHYGGIWRVYFKLLIRLGLSKNSTVIATSEYTRTSLLKFISPNQAIAVIYQSVQLKGLQGWDLTRKTFKKNERYFLHVGVFERRKNLKVLIKAFKLFHTHISQEYRLVLVGSAANNGTIGNYAELQKMVDAEGLNDTVLFTGYLSNEELIKQYCNAFAYVFPSLNEGFGIPILEAMHYGLPVIVSNKGALAEVGGDAVILFDADDAKDLCDKMKMLHADESVRQRYIALGRSRVELFTRQKFAINLEKLIAEER